MISQHRSSARVSPVTTPAPNREASIYTVLLTSVGRTRFCTPLKSLLAKGDEQ
ncbi:hypothetical protein ABIB85_007500 [Bradyrhizobium sp. JR1.5]